MQTSYSIKSFQNFTHDATNDDCEINPNKPEFLRNEENMMENIKLINFFPHSTSLFMAAGPTENPRLEPVKFLSLFPRF